MVAIEEDDSSQDADISTDDEDTHVPARDGQESTPHLPDIQQHVPATDGHSHTLTNIRIAPYL